MGRHAEWRWGALRHHSMGRSRRQRFYLNQTAAYAGYSNAKTPYYICTGWGWLATRASRPCTVDVQLTSSCLIVVAVRARLPGVSISSDTRARRGARTTFGPVEGIVRYRELGAEEEKHTSSKGCFSFFQSMKRTL